MFPIRDHNPSGRTPYVTYALIAINVAIFLLQWPAMSEPSHILAIYEEWALIPSQLILDGELITLVSSMFMHGGVMHLLGNMLFLFIFGDNLEDEMGHLGFTLFYLMCGVGAGMVHVFSDPNSMVPTVGASGAIAGVMGGYLLLYPKARVDIIVIFIVFFKVFPVPAWIMLGLWFVIQLFSGVAADLSGGGVAYWAHAGGFVIGVILTIPTFLRRGGTGYWGETHGHPPHPEATYRLARTSIPKVNRK